MNEGLIPARYAKALYLVGVEKGSDSRIYDLMKTLDSAFALQSALQTTLSNPYVSDTDKVNLLTIAASAGSSDDLYSDFLKLLARNHRLNMAHSVAKAYIDIYRKANKIYEVKVVSAAKMNEEMQRRLTSLIERHLGGGTMEFTSSVDPSLIGGFTVSVGNERIDASVSNELKQLRLNLISN